MFRSTLYASPRRTHHADRSKRGCCTSPGQRASMLSDPTSSPVHHAFTGSNGPEKEDETLDLARQTQRLHCNTKPYRECRMIVEVNIGLVRIRTAGRAARLKRRVVDKARADPLIQGPLFPAFGGHLVPFQGTLGPVSLKRPNLMCRESCYGREGYERQRERSESGISFPVDESKPLQSDCAFASAPLPDDSSR